jgi:endogenous inhibitor of DNA gyrase (YacG/DUF329 family)
VLRANRQSDGVLSKDVAIDRNGRIVEGILRYADILAKLDGRNDIRDVATRYEAVALAARRATMPQLTCPTCHKKFDSTASRALPFCSDRCRQIDLGRWLNEEQRLPINLEDEEERAIEEPDSDK